MFEHISEGGFDIFPGLPLNRLKGFACMFLEASAPIAPGDRTGEIDTIAEIQGHPDPAGWRSACC
jgi:hypothetical protein